MILREGRGDILGEIRRHHVQDAQTVLEEAMDKVLTFYDHQLRWGTKTGACITVLPSTVNGMELGAQE